jgi:hypothetical protein
MATATVNVTGAPLAYHRMMAAAGAAPAPGLIPFIVLRQDLTSPYQAAFSLATPPAASAAAATALAAADKANAGKPAPAAAPAKIAPAGFLALKALFPAASIGQTAGAHLIPPKPINLPAASTSYVWTFGDGQTVTTDSPFVVHDYFPAIKPGQVPFAFDVQCHIVHDNVTVTRTLVLYSAYGMCQRNGTTVPHVTGDVYATLNSDRTSFSASVIVYNIEAAPMTIDQMAIVPVWNGASASFPAFSYTKMAHPVIIAAHSSSLLGVQVLRSQLSGKASVTGFLAAFQGTLGAPPAAITVASTTVATPKPIVQYPIVAKPVVAAMVAAPKPVPAAPAPAFDVALLNQLRPIDIKLPTTAASAIRFTRHVRLRLQDQQLPALAHVILHPGPVLLDTLTKAGAIASSVARSAGIAVDSATNVVSVPLTTATPTPAQAAQVRYSVLAALNTTNAGGTK